MNLKIQIRTKSFRPSGNLQDDFTVLRHHFSNYDLLCSKIEKLPRIERGIKYKEILVSLVMTTLKLYPQLKPVVKSYYNSKISFL